MVPQIYIDTVKKQNQAHFDMRYIEPNINEQIITYQLYKYMNKCPQKYISLEFTNAVCLGMFGFKFKSFFEKAKSLKYFSLPHSNLTQDNLKEIIEGLKKSTSLKEVELRIEVNSNEELKPLAEALECHPTVRKFGIYRANTAVDVHELFKDTNYEFKAWKLFG